MRRRLRNWSDPSYWHWWWHERVDGGEKVAFAVAFAVLVGLAGYMSAAKLSGGPEAAGEHVITLKRTVVESVGPPAETAGTGAATATTSTPGTTTTVPASTAGGRVVTVGLPGGERVVTTTRNQRVVVTTPGQTVVRSVTVPGKTRDRVVTTDRTLTETRAQTVDRPVTVTNESTRAVTVTGPTQTVSRTVTDTTVVTTVVTTTVTETGALATVTVRLP